MSDVGVFPQLPGKGWNVSKSPTFQTRIQRAASGRELRALDYPFPLWQFELVFDFLRSEAPYQELQALMGFLMQCQGAFGTFLFDDPTDDTVVGQEIGTGDGQATQFPLYRTLGGFVEPIAALKQMNAVRLNGTPTSAWTTVPSQGLLVFNAPPANGVAVTADFEFYFRCRFADDSYSFENFLVNLWTLKKLTFISVRA